MSGSRVARKQTDSQDNVEVGTRCRLFCQRQAQVVSGEVVQVVKGVLG